MYLNKENILYKILPFGIIWLVFAVVYVVVERGILGGLQFYPSSQNPYSFARNLITTPILSFILGLMMGAFEVLYLTKLYEGRKFRNKILIKSLIYAMIILFFMGISSALANSLELKIPFFSSQAWRHAESFFTSYTFLGSALYIIAVIVVSLFYMEITRSVGKNTISNFFIGTYNQPITEEGIFMFVDMNSSTSHAEKLGHQKYFKLLQEYYKDITIAIVKYQGDIYQYVGDQIIVTWTLERGLRFNRCIKCFLKMRKILEENRPKYLEKYGLYPEFKVGLHTGTITTGEIGEVRKEILFTGDVLNSTARIMGLCKDYNVDILLSKELVDKLESPTKYTFQNIGQVKLKGKKQVSELYTLI